MAKKNIVIIGGGSASAAFLEEGLKNYEDRLSLTVIASMADDGGSTGRLRRELDVSALGSLRKCLLALSDADKNFKKAFAFRFSDGKPEGHVAGNIFMASLEKATGSAEKALEITSKILKIKGEVIPSTFSKVILFARLENGEIIKGETNIDIPKHDGNLKIKKVFLRPGAELNPKAWAKILAADLIVIGPGDFYTTVIPNFLVKGIKEAVQKSGAKKVLVANIVTKFGETNEFSVLDFARETEKYVGSPLDFVVYNSKIFSKEKIKKYRKSVSGILDFTSVNKNLPEEKFIGKNISLENNPAFYDHKKLARILISII